MAFFETLTLEFGVLALSGAYLVMFLGGLNIGGYFSFSPLFWQDQCKFLHY